MTADSRGTAVYSVKNIGFVCDGRRIRKVHYTSGSETFEIDADVVIVAAGALGSPKVLQSVFAEAGQKVCREKFDLGKKVHQLLNHYGIV